MKDEKREMKKEKRNICDLVKREVVFYSFSDEVESALAFDFVVS